MRIKLDTRWTKRLMGLPESGMGYQRVDVLFADGQTLQDVPVFNAEEMDVPKDLANVAISDVRLHVVKPRAAS